MQQGKLHVLLVEDDDIDQEALTRCLTYSGSPFVLKTVTLAGEALALLRTEWAVNHPFVILLDLNLPGVDGIEFLKTLRCDPQLSVSVVIVLSSSTSEEDRNRTRTYDIAGYIPKNTLNCAELKSLLTPFIR